MKTIITPLILGAALALTACSGETTKAETSKPENTSPQPSSTAALNAALAARSDKMKIRDAHRNPAETLTFFGVKPGMKIAEALPGGNYTGAWYTNILVPYLSKDGHLSGVDYPADMWPKFGFFDDEFIDAKASWPADFTANANTEKPEDSAFVDAFTFATIPVETAGSYDGVLFIRALHNLSRFESDGGYLTKAISASYDMLKPGGFVGVVQHRAPESAADDSVSGNRGYVKESDIIKAFEAGGFTLVGSSEINANAADVPSDEDIVWRLPPSLSTSRDNPDQAAVYKAIGESDRMTLKFVKK